MADWVSVPLGVDIGTTRLRIAHSEKNRAGEVRLRAVATRDLPENIALANERDYELLASVFEDALGELATRERRCVFAIGLAQGAVRHVKLPRMSWAERLRAARFEVARWPGFAEESDEVTVRVHPVTGEENVFAIGATSARAIAERVKLARTSGLHPVGVDHVTYALRRLLPDADTIVDIGADRTCVHAFGPMGPLHATIESGGTTITKGIARELCLSMELAEKRKRILGCAGAGTAEQDALIAAISASLERMRAKVTIDRVALIGNGGRLPEFTQALEAATGARVEMPVPPLLHTSPYPADVTRSAAPDWALAAGLTSWSTAA